MKNQQIKILSASFLSLSLLLLVSINLISCKSTQTKNQNNEILELNKNPQNQENQTASSSTKDSNQNFSHNTIIVYLENGTSQKEISELAQKYNLQILYVYKNFSACALSSQKTLSTEELNALISALESEPKILSTQKDYILNLD